MVLYFNISSIIQFALKNIIILDVEIEQAFEVRIHWNNLDYEKLKYLYNYDWEF